MLVLTRRVGEVIVIEGDIRITVVSVRGDRVRLGITAPEFVQVDREEVHERRVGSKASEQRACDRFGGGIETRVDPVFQGH